MCGVIAMKKRPHIGLWARFNNFNAHDLHVAEYLLFGNNKIGARRPITPISKIHNRAIIEANCALICPAQVIAPSNFVVGGYFGLNSLQILECILCGYRGEPVIV